MKRYFQISFYLLLLASVHAVSNNDTQDNKSYTFDSIPYLHDIEEYYLNGRFDSAIKLCNLSSNYFKSFQDWLNYSEVRLKMSSINRMSGYYKKASRLIAEVGDVIKMHNLKDSLLLSDYLLESAILYQYLGKYKESIILLDSGFLLIPTASKKCKQ